MTARFCTEVEFVHPIRRVVCGALQVEEGLPFPQASFALTLVDAGTGGDDKGVTDSSGWAYSPTLQRKYAYLGAVTAQRQVSWATQELSFTRPVTRLTLEIVPWNARGTSWLQHVVWEAIAYRAETGPPVAVTLSGFSRDDEER
ncbi:hypothetical protein AWH69_15255 [Janibacter melonis]|uniref:Uncharacterized protein n=1 Tax=Janibacter melonis TaxID=262209 RepID=A0A176Q964_9MICO|nr:hypothetical protein AWH69_15255 [Janibacter melonis]